MKIYKMRLILLLISLVGITTICPTLFAADTFQLWIAHFNSPDNLDDTAWDLEVDAQGNVYVIGMCDKFEWGTDVVLLKYDSEKELLWQHFLDVQVSPFTRGFVELDGDGNVYISFSEISYEDPNQISDTNIVTRKYDPTGVMLWEKKMEWLIQGRVIDFVVDNVGNAYVARGGIGEAIVKYDTNGDEQWVVGAPVTSDIELDGSGNICVTGTISTGPGQTSLSTYKLTPEGEQIWFIHSFPYIMDGGLAVAVDSEGVVHVAGVSLSGGDNIVKFGAEPWCSPADPDYCYMEEIAWKAHFGPDGWPNSIAVDANGNVYVSGSSRLTESSLFDCLTVKYDSEGNKLWDARYDGPANDQDLGVSLALDDDANVYVACQSRGGDSLKEDYVTIMYDTNGNQMWVKRYDGPKGEEDYVTALKIDNDGNVYVTGSTLTDTGFDFATIKYAELTTSNAITSLILSVEDMSLDYGLENSLISKIDTLLKSLDKSNKRSALNQLQSFINQIEGIRGIKLTDEQADELIEKAQEIIALLV